MVNSTGLDVGGKASIGGGEVREKIDVWGLFQSSKLIKFGKIDVGGSARLLGGGEGRDIEVGGKFESNGDIHFETIDVRGICEIRGNGEGESVDIGGILEVTGGLKLTRNLYIGGRGRKVNELRLEALDVRDS